MAVYTGFTASGGCLCRFHCLGWLFTQVSLLFTQVSLPRVAVYTGFTVHTLCAHALGLVNRITPRGLKMVRNLVNDCVMDVFYYFSPKFGPEVIRGQRSVPLDQHRTFLDEFLGGFKN